MAHSAYTSKLTPDWDLQLTPEGNIYIERGAYAIAQNLANEIRLWTNDAYFQVNNGIDWKEIQLAKKLDKSVVIQVIKEAGLRTAGVASVDSVELTEFDVDNRILHGIITITTETNESMEFNF